MTSWSSPLSSRHRSHFTPEIDTLLTSIRHVLVPSIRQVLVPEALKGLPSHPESYFVA